MSQRRKYSPEFKREAVELSQTEGVGVGLLAEELGISAQILSRWRQELTHDGNKAFQGRGMTRWPSLSASWPGSGRSEIFCKKRQRSSRKRRNEIPDAPALSRRLPDSVDVPVFECYCQRLLRLAGPATECQGQG